MTSTDSKFSIDQDLCPLCECHHDLPEEPGSCLVCGCMDSDVTEDLWKILTTYYEAKLNDGCVYYTALMERHSWDTKYCHALLQIIDHHKLIEHGTSIRGSWLTEEGRRYVEWTKARL